MKKQLYFFIGTTAELIKLAPVMTELRSRKLDFKIISSNQNTLRFEELFPLMGKQRADYILKVKPFKNPKNIYLRFLVWLAKTIGNYMLYFKKEFENKEKSNIYLIVHGDTISALLGAVVAKIHRVKLVHIESGLRSFSFLEPFPEEIARFLISWLADYHFCPNSWSVKNIRNRPGKKTNTYSNTVAESVGLALTARRSNKILELDRKKYFILVVHRQEHTLFNKPKTKKIIDSMIEKAGKDLKCVFIMHRLTKDYLNRQKMLTKIQKNENVVLLDRLPYVDFIQLMDNAEFIATDGGSNQEEAYYLGKPCLILRERTERIEGLGKNAVLFESNMRKIEEFFKVYKSFKGSRNFPKKSASSLIVSKLSNL